MLSVHQRPFAPDDRSQPGHWEGDLIVGPDHAFAIGTLVERRTRLIRLLHHPTVDAASLHRALVEKLGDPTTPLQSSITWDQGTEMARHLEITAELDLPVYFCDPHAPWQRGSNENANGLLRQYFPKRTDLSIHSPEHLRAVEDEINARPRLVLADRTPAALVTKLVGELVDAFDKRQPTSYFLTHARDQRTAPGESTKSYATRRSSVGFARRHPASRGPVQ